MSEVRTFEVLRYNPDKDNAPYMQTYQLELEGNERMLLDALLKLKKMDETLSFRRSCREGICGSDGMNVNGKNGLACLINMADLPKKIVIRPLPGLPIIRDLVVDMSMFYNHTKKYSRMSLTIHRRRQKSVYSHPLTVKSSMVCMSVFCARAVQRASVILVES